MNYNLKNTFKAVLSLLATLLFCFQLSSQTLVKGSGIRYYDGYTIATYRNAIAPETSVGTELAYFIDLNIVCKWDRTNSIWVPVTNILSQSGVPVHTPSTGEPMTYLDKDTGCLYTYNSDWSADTTSVLVSDSIIVYIVCDQEVRRDTIKIASAAGVSRAELQDSASAIRGDFPAVSIVDSTRLLQDSILVYYQGGSEINRDTIPVSIGGGGSVSIDTFEVENLAGVLDFDAAIGRTITTRGYSVAGDRGGAKYLVVSPSDTIAGYINDSIAVIPVSNGNYAVLQPTESNGYKPEWFGARIDDNLPDSIAFEKTVSWVTRTGISKRIELAAGTYNDPKLRIYKNDNGGIYETIGLEVVGPSWPYTNNPGIATPTTFKFNANDAGIYIQSARGVKIKNIYFAGSSTAPFTRDSIMVFTEADWARHHAATKYAPHAGIAIDPFYSSSPNQYPGLSDMYVHSGGGSSMINIENCSYANLDVAVAELGTANGDNIRITNANADNLRRFYVTYCSQSRQGSINSVYAKAIQTFFFNDGIGAPPAIRNVSGAGFVREAINAITQESKITMDNCQWESLYRIGRAVGFPTSFVQCQFKFDSQGEPIAPAILASSGSPVTFTGTTLVYFTNCTQRTPMTFNGTGVIHFDGCHIQGAMPVSNRRLTGIDNLSFSNTNLSCYTSAKINSYSTETMYTGGETLVALHGQSEWLAQSDNGNRETTVKFNVPYSTRSTSIGSHVITMIDDDSGTITVSDSTERIGVGDALMTSNSIPNDMGDANIQCGFGYVESISGTTVTISGLVNGVVDGGAYTLHIVSPQKPLVLVIGDTEAGNDTIKNVRAQIDNSFYSPFLKNVKLSMPQFKAGTYLTGSDIGAGDWITTSSPAITTDTNVTIITVPYDVLVKKSSSKSFSGNTLLPEGTIIEPFDPLNSTWSRGVVTVGGKAGVEEPTILWQSAIESTSAESNGDIPIWNAFTNRYEPGVNKDGVFTGSGNVPSNVVATLADNITFGDGTKPLLTVDESTNTVTIGGDDNTDNRYLRYLTDQGANGIAHGYWFANEMGLETASSTNSSRSYPALEFFRHGDTGSGTWPGAVTTTPANSIIGRIDFNNGANALFSWEAFLGTDATTGTYLELNDNNSETAHNTLLRIDRGTGNVEIPTGDLDMGKSAAKITPVNQLEIITDGSSSQSRILMNSLTAGGGTVIEDRDPGTPANAANLTLNWDGTSTLTTDNQSFDFNTGTATSNWGSSTFNFESTTELNLMTIRKPGPGELLRYQFDSGVGGGYQLMYEDDSGSPFSDRTIFDVSGNVYAIGSGFTDFRIAATIPHTAGEADEKVMVLDSISDQVRLMALPILRVVSEESSSFTAVAGTEVPVNSTSGAITVTPPASPTAGMVFAVFDSRSQAATNNITIDTSGDNLNGTASDYVINTSAGYVELKYINATIGWRAKD